MTIKSVLFDLGDTLWHFPEMPPAMTIRSETVRRISGVLKSWDVPMEGDLRFLGRDIRLGVEKADRAAYESDCISPDFNETVRQIVAGKGLEISYEQGAQMWDAWNLGGLTLGRAMFDDAYKTLDWLRGRGVRIGFPAERDVVTDHQQRRTINPWMPALKSIQLSADEARQHSRLDAIAGFIRGAQSALLDDGVY